MVQARGIMLRENVKTIGHMIRLYTNKNTTLNGTGKNISYLISFLKELYEEIKKLCLNDRAWLWKPRPKSYSSVAGVKAK